MPSLRKRVTSYIRQLSFHNEPREKRQNINENSFVTKYLQGQIKLKDGPPVISGKIPTDLPNYDLASYTMGSESIIGCYTGPNGGLTTVKRTEKHLSVTDPDIDYIDTQEENVSQEVKLKLENKPVNLPIDNTTMVIKVAGQEYFVTNRKKQIKSQSMGSLSELNSDSLEMNENEYISISNDHDSIPSIQDTNICNGTDIDKVSNSENMHPSKIQKDSVSRRRKSSVEKVKRESIGCDSKGIDTGIVISKESAMQKQGGKSSKHNLRNSEVCASELKHIHGSNKNISEHGRRRSGSNRSNSSIKNFQSKNIQSKQSTGPVSNINREVPEKANTPTKKPEHEKSRHKQNYGLAKSKSEGNPFEHRKKGKIIRLSQRPISAVSTVSGASETDMSQVNDSLLPEDWQRHSDYIYGLSDSLYDRNQITKLKNGDPIADCFGIVARKDSAILAVADGVNWGEKACIAAKSAIHGCLHYLNKTIFNDVKPFENLVKTDAKDVKCETPLHDLQDTHITNTQEVFVCLLRAFNCAHDLILENNGMLTTLTVAVVLPLKPSGISKVNGENPRKSQEGDSYICCVCNVGDTLAYVYSHRYGIRELTKGSHDIQSNRDMRDALGALGPVDGTNPELSNLTLSVTKLQKGDIILLASDGLTDNFDPNVCKFTVNSSISDPLKTKRDTSARPKEPQRSHKVEAAKPKPEEAKKPPVKPPRRNYVKGKDNISRSSTERSTRSASEDSSNIKIENLKKSTVDVVDNLNVLQHRSSGINIIDNPKTDSLNSNFDLSKKSPPTNISPDTSQMNNNLNKTTDEMSNKSEDDTNSNNRQDNSGSSPNTANTSSSTSNAQGTRRTQDEPAVDNPLIAQFLRENSLDENASLEKCRKSLNESKPIRNFTTQLSAPSSHTIQYQQPASRTLDKGKELQKITEGKVDTPRYSFLRSKTSLDLRVKTIQRNEDGIPYVNPVQRYELSLLLMEDILKHGISGRDPQCVTAKKLCENLMRFTFSITAAKRRTLEDNDLYYDNHNGLLVEISAQEKKIRRKKGLEKVQTLPGKLDHVTVVAFNIGNYAFLP